MEFDEIRKIWDSQNNEPMYAINEKALHQRILSKKNKGYHITNISELLMIITNIAAGSFVFGMSIYKQNDNAFMYLLVVWMFATALFCLVSRIRRRRGSHQFDRSMLGDLSHALSIATYQVRFSLLARWNIVPMGTLILLGTWDGGKSVWFVVSILVFLVLTNYAAGWEHNFYKGRQRELEALQSKLEEQ
jgi:hypothetical protein